MRGIGGEGGPAHCGNGDVTTWFCSNALGNASDGGRSGGLASNFGINNVLRNFAQIFDPLHARLASRYSGDVGGARATFADGRRIPNLCQSFHFPGVATSHVSVSSGFRIEGFTRLMWHVLCFCLVD